MYPSILLFGPAGSGKDTIANFLVQDYRAIAIAQADPMKRLARDAFAFSEEQLWGPTHTRNAVDTRFAPISLEPHAGFPMATAPSPLLTDVAGDYVRGLYGKRWVADVMGRSVLDPDVHAAHSLLVERWFNPLAAIADKAGGLSPRAVLQTLGTEWGRYVDLDLWVNYADRVGKKILSEQVGYDRTQGVLRTGARVDLLVITDGRFHNEALGHKRFGSTVIRVCDPAGEAASLAAQQGGIQGHASETAQKTIPDSWFDGLFLNDKSKGLEACRSRVRNMLRILRFDSNWMF